MRAIIKKEGYIMKKVLSRLFLLSAMMIVIGLATDVYGGPSQPEWNSTSVPINPLPITITYLP